MRCVLPILVCVVGCSGKDSTPAETDTDTDTDTDSLVDSGGATDSIDNGDGTYSHAVPPGFDPGVPLVEGPLTWTYQGQAKFSKVLERTVEETFVVDAELEESLSEQLLGTVRLDAEGRLWTLSAVDVGAATELIQQALLASKEEWDDDIDGGQDEYGDSMEIEAPGEVVTWEPLSWKRGDCDSSGGWFATQPDNHYYRGDDDRVRVTGPLTARQSAIVDVRVDGHGQCTGTIVGARWVLTAGHCLFDQHDNPIDLDDLTVVRLDGSADAVHTVRDTFVSPKYNPRNADFSDDYALIKLDLALAQPFEDMGISSASERTLKGLDDPRNLALPGFAPWCADNLDSNGVVASMYENGSGGLGAITSQRVNLKMDAGPGHSGSPVFYCPSGDDDVCGGGERGFIIAVLAGWDGRITSIVASRASRFHEWAETLIN